MDGNNSDRAVKPEAQKSQAVAGRYIITAQTVKAEPVKVEAALPYAQPGQQGAQPTQAADAEPVSAEPVAQPTAELAAGQPAGQVSAEPAAGAVSTEQAAGLAGAEPSGAEHPGAEPIATEPAQPPREKIVVQTKNNKDNKDWYPKVGTQLPVGMYTRQEKKSRRKNKGVSDMLINSPDTPFQYQEAFHFLRTSIDFLSTSRECKKIIVTSSIPNEGKTTVAINLALSLTAANNSVVLVDADLRKPSIHNYLSVSPDMTMGLTDALRDRIDVRACVHKEVDRKSLYFIPSGMVPPNPTELMGSSQMGELLATLGEFFDYVILDTPPVAVVTDAAVLSRYTDGSLLVIRQKMASFEQAKIAKNNIESVGGRILGVVLNNFNRKHLDKNSGYYYSYYYGEKQYSDKKR